jgi:Phage Tail Collar Domain
LKRAPFLGAGAAAFLTGCGANHLVRALPGVAALKGTSRPDLSNARLVPAVADAIPDYVVQRPIVGETARFDGAAAPLGWLACQGQTLTVAENQHLFKILGSMAGGDGKTTFALPKGRALIIAAGGVFPSTPRVFAQSGRHTSRADSLGPGARPAALRMKPTSWEKTAAERQLVTRAIQVGRPSPAPVPSDVKDRIERGNAAARSAVLERLSAANRARLEAALEAVVDGRTTLHGAVLATASSLSDGEADALLGIHDAMVRDFRGGGASEPHRNLRLEAAYFAVGIAFTREQKQALWAREKRELG